MATVAIIGGGKAGGFTARLLGRRVGGKHRVVLIEKEAAVYNRSFFPLLATGRYDKSRTARDTTSLSRKGIQLVVEEALKIDYDARRVTTTNHEICYDLLLIAAGAEADLSAPAGMAEAGININTLHGAEEIHTRLKQFSGDEVAVIIASLTVKYPPAPYEYALLLEDWFRRSGRSRDVAISIYTPEPYPLHVFGPRVGEAAAELLLKRHIRTHLNSPVKLVDPAQKTIHLEHGTFPFDLLLYSPAAIPARLLGDGRLAGEGGWMDVDPHTLASVEKGVFGMGDAAGVITPAGEILPKTGTIAWMQARVAAANAAGFLQSGRLKHTYDGTVRAAIETGRGALPFFGSYYRGAASLRPLPVSRLWRPFSRFFDDQGAGP